MTLTDIALLGTAFILTSALLLKIANATALPFALCLGSAS